MEEDLKVWQQKRQERDQLSSAMGEHLLKGYRMLDSYCSDCNGILMSGPGQSTKTLCISCSQLANGKDVKPSAVQATPTKPTSLEQTSAPEATPLAPHPPPLLSLDDQQTQALESTRRVLLGKLTWAQTELEHCHSVEHCSYLCQLIQCICITLRELKP